MCETNCAGVHVALQEADISAVCVCETKCAGENVANSNCVCETGSVQPGACCSAVS